MIPRSLGAVFWPSRASRRSRRRAARASRRRCAAWGIPRSSSRATRRRQLLPSPGFTAERRRVWAFDEMHHVDASVHRPQSVAEAPGHDPGGGEDPAQGHRPRRRLRSLRAAVALGETLILIDAPAFRAIGKVAARRQRLAPHVRLRRAVGGRGADHRRGRVRPADRGDHRRRDGRGHGGGGRPGVLADVADRRQGGQADRLAERCSTGWAGR